MKSKIIMYPIGEMTQLCLDEGIVCRFIHASEELALSVMKSLGLGVNEKSGADDSGVGADINNEGDIGLGVNGVTPIVVESPDNCTKHVGGVGLEKGGDGVEVEVVSENGQGSGAKTGRGTAAKSDAKKRRRSSRRRGGGNVYQDMTTQSLLAALSEVEKGIEGEEVVAESEKGEGEEGAESENNTNNTEDGKGTGKGGRLGMGKLSK